MRAEHDAGEAAARAPADQRPSRRTAHEFAALLGSALSLVWRSGRREAVWAAAIAIGQSLVSLGLLAVIARLVSAIRDGSDDSVATDVAPAAIGFVVLLIAQGALALMASELRFLQGELVMRQAESLVAGAAANAPLIDFDDPAFHDRLQRALSNSAVRPLTVASSLMAIATSAVSIVGLVIAILLIQPLLLAVIVLGAAPLWLLTRTTTRLGFRFALAESEADRRRNYFLYVLTAKEEAQEVRAYSLDRYLDQRHQHLWDERIDRVRSFLRRRSRIGLVSRLVNGVLVGGVLGVLLWTVSTGRTGVDGAAAAAAAVVMLGQRLNALVAAIGGLYECGLFLRDTESFLRDYRPAGPTNDSAPLSAHGVLRANELHFTYPSGASSALNGVSLEVATGQMIALVGVNGSGKTTLAKIVAGLLPAAAGSVSWNDEPIGDEDSWRGHVAIVFQDFSRYMLTVAENIGFGRVAHIGDTERLEAAATTADIADWVQRLHDGYDTLLGPEFIGGTDLSGGQWQRVALARAFFRDAPVVILDEPSAALDPVAEDHLFSTIRELCSDRAVIVISHRFSTVTAADRIYVLDGGTVIEEGTHHSLLALGARYAEMFRLQADRYATRPSAE